MQSKTVKNAVQVFLLTPKTKGREHLLKFLSSLPFLEQGVWALCKKRHYLIPSGTDIFNSVAYLQFPELLRRKVATIAPSAASCPFSTPRAPNATSGPQRDGPQPRRYPSQLRTPTRPRYTCLRLFLSVLRVPISAGVFCRMPPWCGVYYRP